MADETQRRSSAPLVLAIAAVLAVAVLAILALGRGVRVTVSNVGPTAISGVVVHVTGATYELGEIGPGEDGTVRVTPTGESDVEVRWNHPAGRACSDRVECYFERSGYRGSVSVQIDGSSMTGATEDIDLGF